VQLYPVIEPEAHTVEVYCKLDGNYSAPQIFLYFDVWQPAELPNFEVSVGKLWSL
jgi:Uma2 family endonuclease